jgi:hypothetical protein
MNKKLIILGLFALSAGAAYLAYSSLKAVDWDFTDIFFEDEEEEF